MKPLLASLLVAFAAAACSGKPAIPDEQQAREYSSTATSNSEEPVAIEETTSSTAPVATGPVATVNGVPITADEFNTEIERGVAKGMQPGLLRQLADQLVSQLIDRTLIDSAVASSHINVSEGEINTKMEEVRQEFARVSQASGQHSSLEEATAAMGISPEELRESLIQAIAIEKVLAKRGFSEPDDAAVKKFYEDNKPRFERTEQVRLSHIVIAVEDTDDQAAWDAAEAKAKTVHAEAIKKDADFAALAEANSDDAAAPNGGDLGFHQRGNLIDEIESIAFQMKVNDVSAPIKSQAGWHVVKITDRAEAGIVPYEEIADQLKSQLKTEAVNGALTAFLSELRADAKVERFPDNIR